MSVARDDIRFIASDGPSGHSVKGALQRDNPGSRKVNLKSHQR